MVGWKQNKIDFNDSNNLIHIFKNLTFNKAKMVDNVLLSNESEMYIRCIEPQKLNDIGNQTWIDFHNRLQKLNQQALLEATEVKEESIKEMLISYNKITVLVQEALCISVWKTKILPRLLKIEPEPQTTILLYTVLYHEAICVALLEIVLFHPESMVSLGDNALDLFDYIYETITYLITIKHTTKEGTVEDCNETMLDELNRQRDDLLFDIGIRSISILRYFSDNMHRLPLSISSRMFTTYDTPLLLIELLDKAPWCKRDSKNRSLKYINNKWKIVEGEELIKLSQTEAQIWLTLHQILLDPTFSSSYELTDFRKAQLTKLQKYMNDDLLDQIAPLVELKHWLYQISVMDSSSTPKKNLILLETVPQIKQFYLEFGNKKWKNIAKTQATWFFNMNKDERKELAQSLCEAYNTDFVIKLEDSISKICATCGNKGIKKCSQCKNEWYCGRECQVKHWNIHKEHCTTST